MRRAAPILFALFVAFAIGWLAGHRQGERGRVIEAEQTLIRPPNAGPDESMQLVVIGRDQGGAVFYHTVREIDTTQPQVWLVVWGLPIERRIAATSR